MRDRLRGVRVIGVEESKLPIADLVFTYRSPIVEVYVDAIPTDEHEDALVAPPWSSVPWHVLALMEAAVEREIAAFSQSEAKRRNLPWLDLARDPAQRDKLRALIKEFATAGYRPAALESLVNAQAATARWQALDQFVEANNHLLVTNGPYRLRSFSPDVYTFDVIREFTYPVGLGTFDFYADPAKAFVTRVEHIGNRILVTADAEIALKQQARSPHRSRVAQARHAARDAADPAGGTVRSPRREWHGGRSRGREPGRRRTLCRVAAAESPGRQLQSLHGYLSRRQHDQSDHRPHGLSEQLRQWREIRGAAVRVRRSETPQIA